MKRVLPILLIFLMLIIYTVPADSESGQVIIGVDVSELLSQEKSGVVYYDASGRPADALAVLGESGVSHVRLRVWNDPFDEQGRGYGAGNIDAEAAAELSARAARLGMKTLLDFHYSDFWADPYRQIEPKAWRGMNLSQKEAALEAYTEETLRRILDAGGDVDMVQVGNETNNGMAGEYDLDNMAQLIAAGCRAVRKTAAAYNREIKVCVHLTNPEDYGYLSYILRILNNHGADYDAVGLSYYPFWGGSPEGLAHAIESIRGDFGKEAFVAETSWPFTLEDGDGSTNNVDYDPGVYPVSPEGQAQEFREVYRCTAGAGGTAVFYWGGIWTPVSPDGEANKMIWETCGSGWATRFASPYDPEYVGEYYGGCAWDNQALFDFTGHPLPVLDAMRQLSGGLSGGDFREQQPERATVSYETQNLVLNPSFENADFSMWETSTATAYIPYDFQDNANDAHTGTVAFHFWSEQDMSFRIQQTVYGLELGKYEASVFSQGGDMTNASMVLYVIADGQYYETSFMNTTWANWQHPVITDIPVAQGTLTVGVKITCGRNSWGTLDDFSVVRIAAGE